LQPLTWVKVNRKGDVAGTIGSLFRWSDVSEKNFSRAIQAFMAYSFYILPSLTEEQKEKFLSGINPEKDDGLDESFHKDFSNTIRRTIRERSIPVMDEPLVAYQGSSEKKAPRLFGRSSVKQNENILDDLLLFNTTGGLSLFKEFKDLYSPLLKGLGERQKYLNWIGSNPVPLGNYSVLGGEIHFLQENGGKLRSIASPLRIHQQALKPLGKELYRLIQLLPWDCTHDQTCAIPHIQSCLRQGGHVHSVDLSSATDHFPLSLQETALRAIFKKEFWKHIDLFIKISRAVWKSPIGDLSWTKGQPLGLYPSFGSFTLTHGLLLLHLAGGDYHNQFFVVGDDVIILEDKLRDDYISMLDRMSCPWSADKSISSSSLAEFAGKIITSEKVIPQLKWRRMSNDNFLDICRLLGRKSRCLLTKRQQKVFDQVAHLCDPIGLNFSLPDDNLEKMIMRTEAFYSPERVVLGSLMGLRRKLNNIIYTSSESFDSNELKDISATFDEKVKSALSQTVFCRWRTSVSIGLEAFEKLPEALGLEPRLPLLCTQPSRLSTLDRYERILQY
jgi:hypothetical protein